MKNVLITGGAGFIAHHVIEYIINHTDWNVVSLDRLDFSGNLNRLAHMMESYPSEKRRIKIVHHDLKAEINPMIQKLIDRKSTRLNSSHIPLSRMPSSA